MPACAIPYCCRFVALMASRPGLQQRASAVAGVLEGAASVPCEVACTWRVSAQGEVGGSNLPQGMGMLLPCSSCW